MQNNLFKTYLEHYFNYYKDLERLEMNATVFSGLRALTDIKNGIACNVDLVMDLIYPERARLNNTSYKRSEPFGMVDDTQELAVIKALNMNNILVIQGPPGAGKSTTISEIVSQILTRNPKNKILLTSQTHVAVDGALAKIAKTPFAKEIVRAKFIEGKTSNDFLSYSVNNYFKNLSNKNNDVRLKQVLKSFDVPKEESYINNFLVYNQDDILKSKSIIGVTINSLLGCKLNIKTGFDYAIVDEVGKFNFAELLTVAMHAKKLILIGDHKQLPPVYNNFPNNFKYNKDSYDFITNNSYIEYIFENINSNCKVFLDKQYRMNNIIGRFISYCFYDSKLLNGLDKNSPTKSSLNFIPYDANECLVKTSHKDGIDTKLINTFEIKIILNKVKELLKRYKKEDISIITPYSAQMKQLRKDFSNIWDEKEIIDHINTIDAFQGQENKVVIFSCVRNCGKITNFFKYPNRLNVAVSRAKEEVYIVGAPEYLKQSPSLNKYMHFCYKEHNKIIEQCNIDNTYINKKS